MNKIDVRNIFCKNFYLSFSEMHPQRLVFLCELKFGVVYKKLTIVTVIKHKSQHIF